MDDDETTLEAMVDDCGTGVDADGVCEGTDDGDTGEELCKAGVLVVVNIAELE